MIYQGERLTAKLLDDNIVELCFNAPGSVNALNLATLNEYKQAIAAIAANDDAQGVIVTSAKSTFIVGADITEFTELFKTPDEQISGVFKSSSDIFDAFEDLQIPTVAAINGFALGGGCETALVCDYRVADTTARIGLPEVKLGLMPGFGGTVRLPRIIGVDNALEWMTTGKPHKAEDALAYRAIDAVVAPENLRQAALSMVKDAISGQLDWQARKAEKMQPVTLSETEHLMSFSTAKAMVAASAGKHYPAPMAMVELLEKSVKLPRTEAMLLENSAFGVLAKTDACTAQVGLFLADQVVKGKAKKAAKSATTTINRAAVIGAGIMGGGIAYQSAYTNTPILMKDINTDALKLGLDTASDILSKQVDKGRLQASKMAKVLNNITPTLDYQGLADVDIVVEAVVENPKVKAAVLKEVEQSVSESCILTSNTSTISIDELAKNLQNPERFCGMHFFNPVHKMPLVEVIRGEHTSDETVAAVVAYASKMGKSAIVVNDCPGFYVNRILFPYLAALSQLLVDGADFVAVDKVMEKQFGWPMGPAYLLDVVGLDTAVHGSGVMADGFPTRMAKLAKDPVELLYRHNKLGQKNGSGFYDYDKDKRGRMVKVASKESIELLSQVCSDAVPFNQQEIIARLMIPMVNETIRCLEEGIVDTAAEADMACIYGLGFPPFRGGPMRYLETLGLDNFIEQADKYAHLGEMYQVTDGLRNMANTGKSYFDTDVKAAK
ncbi:fatty acid oxidation complex subunit alpha FadB [Thalassotalea ponticola]|uniref:fatty acid oxidation complex subunit alpha FadB n=1 Tax=Thalassotalea ponticola TaxID=1523392 RepID=UPI0025B43930|nr:fatty acid oxidation complex subunit alpha FadB [Thalassotalea ponticola]MDN3653783.1 fatty acid oxidation complex subunit alpha FadB [Thalassotalea ponticola]